MMLRIFAIVMLFVFSSNSLLAQKGVEVGGTVGFSQYFGDLNTEFRFTEPGPALSFLGRYNFNNRISVSGTLTYAYLYAKDSNSENDFEQARNLSFASHIADVSARFEFNFLPYTHGSYDEAFTPYIFGGLSGFYFNPRAELDGTWHNLRPLTTEGQDNEYYNLSGAWLFGGGFKFDISRLWSVNIEIRSYQVFTDYLDDVSGTYPNMTDLLNRRGQLAVDLSDRSVDNELFPEIGEEGRQRGNSKDNDNFNLIQFGLVYYFAKVRCPAISNSYD